jgi:hypothetical protein
MACNLDNDYDNYDDNDNSATNNDSTYDAYLMHHLRWLGVDYERRRHSLEEEERRWMENIARPRKVNDKWKSLTISTWLRSVNSKIEFIRIEV